MRLKQPHCNLKKNKYFIIVNQYYYGFLRRVIERERTRMQLFDDAVNYLFGSPPTAEEQIKEVHKIMDASIRDIKKEMMTTKHERTRTINELRHKAANTNKTSSKELKVLAIRCRRSDHQLIKLDATIDKIKGFKDMATQLRTNEAQMRAFTKMTQAMTKMNQNTNAYQLYALMEQYEVQNMILQEKQTSMDEKIDEGMEDSDGEEEMAEDILQEVMDELNIKLAGDLPDIIQTPKTQKEVIVESKEEVKQLISADEDDLLASRIRGLK